MATSALSVSTRTTPPASTYLRAVMESARPLLGEEGEEEGEKEGEGRRMWYRRRRRRGVATCRPPLHD